MFGKRNSNQDVAHGVPADRIVATSPAQVLTFPVAAQQSKPVHPQHTNGRAQTVGPNQDYYALKQSVFQALIDAIDVAQLSKLDAGRARAEIGMIIGDIVVAKKVVMSTAEQNALLADICNDILGYGPLEPLLARDDISDIMVNGPGRIFIEVGGKVQETDIRFQDATQLLNVCQRIVSQVGRRVDESRFIWGMSV